MIFINAPLPKNEGGKVNKIIDILIGYAIQALSALILKITFLEILRRFMAQIHISKDPPNQVSQDFSCDLLPAGKVKILLGRQHEISFHTDLKEPLWSWS